MTLCSLVRRYPWSTAWTLLGSTLATIVSLL